MGTAWSDVERRQLDDYLRAGLPASEIVQRFPGRSPHAVGQRLKKLQYCVASLSLPEKRITGRTVTGLLAEAAAGAGVCIADLLHNPARRHLVPVLARTARAIWIETPMRLPAIAKLFRRHHTTVARLIVRADALPEVPSPPLAPDLPDEITACCHPHGRQPGAQVSRTPGAILAASEALR